ncbi:hypothetical protein CPAR01_14009, partial [Colletotrichum paranaense]
LEFIEACLVITDIPYTRYFRTKVPYRFREGFSYYRTYIKAKKPCDGVLIVLTRKFIFLLIFILS